MGNLVENNAWPDGVRHFEANAVLTGGPDCPDNLPIQDLADRSRFQRTCNVTPWSAVIAYPIGAYVQDGGTTWKSIAVSTNVQPGTDATKWTRWAHTEAELTAALDDSVAAHEAKIDPHAQYVLGSGDTMTGPLNLVPSAQFDSSTKAASTAFVQRALENYGANVTTIASGVTTLTILHAGLILVDASAGNVTLNLPAANILKALPFTFRRIDTTANTVTVNRTGSDVIDEGTTSFGLLYRGDVRKLTADGATTWRSSIGPQSASMSTAGYQRLPSGLIVQWGVTTDIAANASRVVTLPIAAPNAILHAFVTPLGTGPSSAAQPTGKTGSFSTTQFSIYMDGVGGQLSMRWLAICC